MATEVHQHIKHIVSRLGQAAHHQLRTWGGTVTPRAKQTTSWGHGTVAHRAKQHTLMSVTMPQPERPPADHN